MKPVCEVLSKQGPYVHWLVSQGSNTLTAHLTLVHFIHIHLAFIYNVTDSNGLAGEQMDLQVYMNPYTGSTKREGNRNYPKWGFGQGCLDMT